MRTLGRRLWDVDPWMQTKGHRLREVDSGVEIMGRRLWDADSAKQTLGCRLRNVDSRV